MEIEIKIYARESFDRKPINISENTNLTYKGEIVQNAAESPFIIYGILTIGGGVASGFIANYLYDKWKNKPIDKLTINKRELKFNKGEIERIIEETIENTRYN
jgi:hypothetical protein